VGSIAVGPGGLTKHRNGLHPLRMVTKEDALQILSTAETYGQQCLDRFCSRVVYCSDELFLRAELPIPDSEYYEEYPQIENGVGLMASFEDEVRDFDAPRRAPAAQSIVTGCAAAPFLQKMLALLEETCHNRIEAEVYPIRNEFLGETVDVAGLVSGGDIIRQLRGKPLGSRLLIPATMLRHGGDVFLDDVTLSQLQQELGVPVIPVEVSGTAFAEAIFAL